MKVLLDIEDNRVPFFMELLKSLDYISILKEVRDKEQSKAIQDMAEAFNDVKLHQEGKKQLKSAKDLSFDVIATGPFERKLRKLPHWS
jgi:hypothetical protein